MLNYPIEHIAHWVSGRLWGPEDTVISNISIDSRSVSIDQSTLFIALQGAQHNGHDYIPDLIQKGIKCFLVNQAPKILTPEITYIQVEDSLKALQALASHHRRQFSGKVIAITGSNGKTIIKEWLSSVLSSQYKIHKNPGSYNSQVGVALALLAGDPRADFHILEAGISQTGEMELLQKMLQPDIGLFCHFGEAHQKNFISLEQKLEEKWKLFAGAEEILFCSNDQMVALEATKWSTNPSLRLIDWGARASEGLSIKEKTKSPAQTSIQARWKNQILSMNLPFSDEASIENAIHVWNTSLHLGLQNKVIQQAISLLEPIAMRMEQKDGVNGCTLINDFYNSDLTSLKNAIDLLFQQSAQERKSIILSDLQQLGGSETELHEKIGHLVQGKGFYRIIGIGPVLYNKGNPPAFFTDTFPDTASFLYQLKSDQFKNEAILLKGARQFRFEQISSRLESRVHRTILRVRMPAILNNLNFFREKLNPGTKVMAMVKAFSYGSGSYEIGKFLANQNIDYLAVAIIDEGIQLRQAGIKTPIMVLNPDLSQFSTLIEYNLEPEVFNFAGLKSISDELHRSGKNKYAIHLKIDTGMHRLGFQQNEIEKLLQSSELSSLHVKSIFSHLAAADEASQDQFTQDQIKRFQEIALRITATLPNTPLLHILNSAGFQRFPEGQMDMIRLGIGLYGILAEPEPQLEFPFQLESYISQIHQIDAHESIGYGRKGKLLSAGKIGVIPIGYADGLKRLFGNGKWKVKIGNGFAPTIGQICMDMCMVDLSGIDTVAEGDRVVFYNTSTELIEMAKIANTIPYEILTNLSPRVKRIYEFS